jgi:hypothetical protein
VGYGVVRKNPDGTCWNITPQGTAATSVQEPIPTTAGTYQYQVAVRLTTGAYGLSEWASYTVAAAPVVQPVPTRTLGVQPMPPAGPTWLNGGSDIPARALLIWAPVANATAYAISRSWSGGPFVIHNVFPAANALPDARTGGLSWYHFLLSDDSTIVYSFRVNALFVNAKDTTWSSPSPVSSFRSLPNHAPVGFQYSVAPSLKKVGLLSLALSWDAAYPGNRGYTVTIFVNGNVATSYDVTQTSATIDDFSSSEYTIGGTQLPYQLKPKQKTKVCVNTRWPTSVAPTSPWACTSTIN